MTASIRRSGVAARTGVVFLVIAAVVAGLAGPNAAPRASAQGAGLEVLGELDLGCPEGEGTPGKTTVKLLGIDPDAQRLYTYAIRCTPARIIVHDISTEVPTVVQVSPPITSAIPSWKSNSVVVSRELGRIFVLGNKDLGSGADTLIEVYDLETLEYVETWASADILPGFFAVGFERDPDLGRFYLLGEVGVRVSYEVFNIFGTRGNPPQAAIVAIDDTSGERIWVDHLSGCEAALNSNFHGGVIKMSAVRPMLYAFCAGAAQGGSTTGQGGLLQLDVSQQQGDGEGLVDFPSEFFPVSGDYTRDDGGVAGLDPVRERFFAHSLSDETHGAWVFDGDRNAWIGFVAAPNNTNAYFGIDPATGNHYMGGKKNTSHATGWINVTDGGATPVPQGQRFDDIRSDTPWAQEEGPLDIHSNILVDPATGRLFAEYQTNSRGVLVLRDTTPPIVPRIPTGLDELTHDLPDDEARLEFSANTSGFGAQYVQVGGWENLWTRPFLLSTNVDDNPASLRYGSRGATMSLVENIGIAQSGSSASAIATKPDENTPSDAQTKQNDAEGQANEATDGGVDDLSNAVDDASSDDDGSDDEEVQEARFVTCLDGNGEPIENDDPEDVEDAPAYAKVVCDLENLKTTGFARFSGGSGGGGVVVSDSSFDGRTYRDSDRGIVTETEAIAEGIVFGEADVGGFSIDRVTSTATTWAKGLDGTSHVKWVRTVEGMRTIGADGTASEPTSCTTIIESGKEDVEEGDCKSRAEDLNELMPNRFEVKFPMPEVVATPGGAFASVQETETDFLSGQATNNDQRRMVPGMEMTVFADGPQRGRLWVQLAAVKADATFIRSPIQDFEPPNTSTGGDDATGAIGEDGTAGLPATNGEETGAVEVPDSGGTTIASPGTTEGPQVAPDEDPPTTPVVDKERLVGAFGWLPALRSLGDAALTGALYLVFLLPVAEIVRRRRLLDVLTDAGPTDASSLSTPRSPARASGAPVSVSRSPVGSTS